MGRGIGGKRTFRRKTFAGLKCWKCALRIGGTKSSALPREGVSGEVNLVFDIRNNILSKVEKNV
jgi:hypothetical protein